MISRMLSLCGVYMGEDNELTLSDQAKEEGYWENKRFLAINNHLLSELGGGWDYPPKVGLNWEKSARLNPIRSEALELIQQFSAFDLWGWKDPRNSITLPFWKSLIPSIKTIICLRNPVEVADSLLKRNYFSPAMAFNLWYEYNQRILSEDKLENSIVTHYDSYFHDSDAEIRRILAFLELEVSEAQVKKSISTVNKQFRHNQATSWDLTLSAPTRVIELYEKLCNHASTHAQMLMADIQALTPAATGLQREEELGENAQTLSLRLKAAKRIISEKEKQLELLGNLLQSKETLLQVKEMELANIYQSKAWRFVQMIRIARSKLLG